MMNRQFAALVDTLAPTCERLLRMDPLIASQVPAGTPVGGVYLFSEHVHEPDPLRQALLEIYVAVTAKAKYNDFDTH